MAALSERYNLCYERKPNIVAVDFWHVGDVLDFVKLVNEELGASTESSSSSSSSCVVVVVVVAKKGDGADTDTGAGGTITSDTLDFIESINESSSPPPVESPTVVMTIDSYIPTYTPTNV